MRRYMTDRILADLKQKMVVLTGPRQVGKTTLSKDLMANFQRAQYLNWDVPNDRRILDAQSFSPH